ncbi:putative baseplate assembly protein [Amantichitinum ursilacus]|uniref:PA14 domain protein n=1 Tax=Amantichitinum ursilacus TaxID=857265 RepID=A0A0N0XI79_9NEIS|nr:putative baseplate assembly protein [Amantichitinum ursilacus]KPC52480.1 PA14 domain protein [Amantichitinum ursilacus]
MSDADCGCCSGVKALTPVDELNPPGQTALVYRVGTQGRFLASERAQLSGPAPLQGLSTRASDDPALALLDAWAAVLDVLGFYQERIINEGFLRTATERRSVLELGREIGYELRPGVAASTYLAFTLETAPGAPLTTRIDVGTKAQSVPEQDQQAQVFETLVPLQAYAAWNALAVQAWQDALPQWGGSTLYLQGQNTGLARGDMVLIVGDERLDNVGSENWDVRRVASVKVVPPAVASADPLAGYSVVLLDRPLGSVTPHVEPAHANPRCYALRTRAALFGQNAPDWRTMPASLRATYLGIDTSPAGTPAPNVPIAEHPQWPGFCLGEISDPPGDTTAAGTGLQGTYYADDGVTHFQTQLFARVDAQLNFNTGITPALPWPSGVPASNFSARWTGWVQMPHGGSFMFFVTSDDGVRLWVNGTLLVNAWQSQSPITYSGTANNLSAGQKVPIVVEYFQGGGPSTLVLEWSGPLTARHVIPANRLYPSDVHSVHLDASYPKWVPGSWAVLAVPEYQELYQIVENAESARTAFTLSSKTSRLTLNGENLDEVFNNRIRDTAVFGESVALPWAQRPVSGLVRGHVLKLASLQPDLAAGAWLAISGQTLSDAPGNAAARTRLLAGDALAAVEFNRDGINATLTFADGQVASVMLAAASEVQQLQSVTATAGITQITLAADLINAYLPLSVSINANVAPASHGDSKQMQIQPEVVGSGDGGSAFQRFNLRQAPLTYVSASTAEGIASSLQVRVDDLLWHEAANLSALTPTDRSYLVRRGDDGTVTLQFGDGEHGSRLPSGQMNVQATYRVGIGTPGNLKPGQINLLLSRALGVKGVVNPVAASGGTDPEQGEQARANAPLTVLTLDRIVSLRDFENFAAAFAGIGKAQAVWLWNGEGRLVHLTVMGSDGAQIAADSALYLNLTAAIDAVRPAGQALRVAPGTQLRFGLSAGVHVLPDYDSAAVLAAIKSALQTQFGFGARSYGQSLSGSEVVAVMQNVTGVERIDLNTLRQGSNTVPGPDGRLRARGAHWEGNVIAAAQLLLIDPTDIVLTELSV